MHVSPRSFCRHSGPGCRAVRRRRVCAAGAPLARRLDPRPCTHREGSGNGRGSAKRPSPSSVRPRGTPLMRRFGFPLIALLLVLGGGFYWYYQECERGSRRRRQHPPRDSPVAAAERNEKSIAVLPFADMSAEKNQEYMSDGIADEPPNLLAQVPDLRVIARTSSFAFKGQNFEDRRDREEVERCPRPGRQCAHVRHQTARYGAISPHIR